MIGLTQVREVLDSYLQADAHVRSAGFKDFLGSLAAIREAQGADQARAWAARAVTPTLDYSSLRSLRKYLRTSRTDGLRVAVLGGPTTHQLVELLEVFVASAEIPVEIFEGSYGLFRHEVLAEDSALDRFRPQVVFLATSARDVTQRPRVQAGRAEVGAALDAEVAHWQQLWRRANERWGATIVQNTFDAPPSDVFGHFALRHPSAGHAYLQRLNLAFAEQAPPFVILHDLSRLAAEQGAKEWFDPRFYFEAKMPCGPESLVAYAHSVMSLLRALAGKSKKVLVLDLDNTLWGGTVGDLGVGGIQLGQGSSEGETFVAFQQYVKALHDRGILLAVCSKNDDERAREPFQSHPDMVLRLADIACFVANWRDKAENLREIASRLSLGMDSLVFVDDNPAERALVRRLAHRVAVPDMPEDPAGYIQAVACHRYFETTSFTQEDASRTEYYAQNARRQELHSKAEDIDAFLSSLQMTAKVEPVNDLNIERVTQLINKSNQFNLTTRRYTLAEVRALRTDPDWRTLTIRLADKLGDNGLVSVIFLKKSGARMEIDTWLMSCRVLQRGVEHLALDMLVAQARAAGCEAVVGTFIPTEKNGMVRDHFPKLGFQSLEEQGGTAQWVLPLTTYRPFSTHITLES